MPARTKLPILTPCQRHSHSEATSHHKLILLKVSWQFRYPLVFGYGSKMLEQYIYIRSGQYRPNNAACTVDGTFNITQCCLHFKIRWQPVGARNLRREFLIYGGALLQEHVTHRVFSS